MRGCEKPKLVNCDSDKVISAVKKLRKFTTKQKSSSHITLLDEITKKKFTLIQRKKSKPIKQGLMKDFVKKYLVEALGLTEEEIYKYLWC